MNWLYRLLEQTAGPTRSTQAESERSWAGPWTFTGWPALLVLVSYCTVVTLIVRWLISSQVTDHDLLVLILAVVLWRR